MYLHVFIVNSMVLPQKIVILRKVVLYVVTVVAIIKQVIVPLMCRNVSIVSDRRGERKTIESMPDAVGLLLLS